MKKRTGMGRFLSAYQTATILWGKVQLTFRPEFADDEWRQVDPMSFETSTLLYRAFLDSGASPVPAAEEIAKNKGKTDGS